MHQSHLEWTAASYDNRDGQIPARPGAWPPALFGRFGKALWTGIMERLHDRREAREIIEEVFIHAWTRAGGDCANESLSLARLTEMARRRADERLRQRRACERGLRRLSAECGPPLHEGSPDGGAMPAELRGVLQGMIQRLPSNQREILMLSLLRDLTPNEIAKCLDLPLTVVRLRLELGLGAIASAVVSLRREVA